jgi:hypothetical protein
MRNAYHISVQKPERTKSLDRSKNRWKGNNKMDIKYSVICCRLNSNDRGLYEDGNESSDFIKDTEFKDEMSDCQLLKDSSQWI